MSVSRRQFLQNAVAGVGAAASVLSAAQAQSSGARHDGGMQVLLLLEGGVDPLGLLAPAKSRRYQLDRPNIAVPSRALYPLDNGWGLNQEMTAIHGHWARGALQIALLETNVEPSHQQGMSKLSSEFLRIQDIDVDGSVRSAVPSIVVSDPGSLTSIWPALRHYRWRSLSAPENPMLLSTKLLTSLFETCTPSPVVIAMRDHDCHVNADLHTVALLRRLDHTFRVVFDALNDSGRAADSSLLVCSELGRSRYENSGKGTDHGDILIALKAAEGSGGLIVADALREYFM